MAITDDVLMIEPAPRVSIGGITALLAGRYQDALLLFEDVQRLSGGTAFNYLRGLAHYYTGDASRAEEILALRGSTRGDRRSQAVLASLLARRRADSEARALIREIQQGGYTDHHIAYSLGAAYAQLGEFPEAVRWLADAARTGLPCYPWYARPVARPAAKRSRISTDSRKTPELLADLVCAL